MKEITLYVKEDFSYLAEPLEGEKEIFLVYDANVEWAAAEVERVLDSLGSGDSAAAGAGGRSAFRGSLAICATESAKTMDTVVSICRFLMAGGADRGALVLALGGGVTTDMAGFAASIYKRGVRFATLPTTLLSQVDAGIGGKTGVNLDGYKNILGRIQQPEFIYTASCTLKTLPEEEFRSGLAEMLKTFIIDDAPHYRRAMTIFKSGDGGRTCGAFFAEQGRTDAERSNAAALADLTELVRAAAQIKCGVVERDEFETGERRVLNLGHTVGHAIEWWQAGGAAAARYSHGEAVAVGIIQAARVSEALGVCHKGLAAQLEADFEALGLPTQCPVSPETMERAVRQDKKADGDSVHFVLIRDLGRVEVRLLPVSQIINLLSTANI